MVAILPSAIKRHDDWLARWLKAPEQMMQTDSVAKAILAKWKVPMPNQGLNVAEIEQLIAYFKWSEQSVVKP